MMKNPTVRKIGWIATGTATIGFVYGCAKPTLPQAPAARKISTCVFTSAKDMIDRATEAKVPILNGSGAGDATHSIVYTYPIKRNSRGTVVDDTVRAIVPFSGKGMLFDTATISLCDEFTGFYRQPGGVGTRVIGAADKNMIVLLYGKETRELVKKNSDSTQKDDSTIRVHPKNSLTHVITTGAYFNKIDNTFAIDVTGKIGVAAVSKGKLATYQPYGQLSTVYENLGDTATYQLSPSYHVATCLDGTVSFTNGIGEALVKGRMERLSWVEKVLDPSLGSGGNDNRVKDEISGPVPGTTNIAVEKYNNVRMTPAEMATAFLSDLFAGGDFNIVLAKGENYAARYGTSSTPHIVVTENGLADLTVSDNSNTGSWGIVRKISTPKRMAKADSTRTMVAFAAQDTVPSKKKVAKTDSTGTKTATAVQDTSGTSKDIFCPWSLNIFFAKSNTLVSLYYFGTEEVKGVRWKKPKDGELPPELKGKVMEIAYLIGKDGLVLKTAYIGKETVLEATPDKATLEQRK